MLRVESMNIFINELNLPVDESLQEEVNHEVSKDGTTSQDHNGPENILTKNPNENGRDDRDDQRGIKCNPTRCSRCTHMYKGTLDTELTRRTYSQRLLSSQCACRQSFPAAFGYGRQWYDPPHRHPLPIPSAEFCLE